jgi:hypothetical protein
MISASNLDHNAMARCLLGGQPCAAKSANASPMTMRRKIVLIISSSFADLAAGEVTTGFGQYRWLADGS